MVQKNLPPAAKQTKILEYLQSTMQVYTLKELEKILQSVASINQMQAKEYLQALQDENLIRVEKIGSGNWYWCFTSDAKRNREKEINCLLIEKSRLLEQIALVENEIVQEMGRREDDIDVNQPLIDSDKSTSKKQSNRYSFLETYESLLRELTALDEELNRYSDMDPVEITRKKDETKKLKDSALLWTDNIEALEQFLAPILGDRTHLAEIMHTACGDEYVIDTTHMSLISPSPWSTTSRNILNRLNLLAPLRSRLRNLTEFHIRPDEPHRKYSPGDTVKGTVVLTVLKPIQITHLTVCLHGFVRVSKSPNCVNEPIVDPGLSAFPNSRKSQYLGNGHASLFQDEVTLCGEGRLDAGIYEFNFELVFPLNGLPTSIDFERGTISYLITATITRPTAVNATSSCHRKISLVDIVDIGHMLPPKPRTICLTPIARKTKRKSGIRKEREEETVDGVDSKFEFPNSGSKSLADDSLSFCESVDHRISHQNSDLSEIQSITSADNSATSTECSNNTETSFGIKIPGSTTFNLNHQLSKRIDKDQKITARIELLKSGYLPGDNIPVKISIKHRKPIRSMHGVIITLYRHGRIDSTPFYPHSPQSKSKEATKLKHEEYYPKSKTGLGGLSLNSAGSSSIFRKDLAQTFAPIVIDPITLTAVINASIRVPEYVFPTIQNVPGQMITFKYNVEIVLDLGGKLAGQQRHVPLLGTVTLTSSSNYVNSIATRPDQHFNMPTAAWGGGIICTEPIRREKNVVTSTFEITVGSEDSLRSKGNIFTNNAQISVDSRVEEMLQACSVLDSGSSLEESPFIIGQEYDYTTSSRDYYSFPQNDEFCQYLDFYPCDGQDPLDFSDQYLTCGNNSIPVPPPEIYADEGLSDKERAKRAEELLLPSSPPIDGACTSTAHFPVVPSIASGDEFHYSDDYTPRFTPSSLHILEISPTPPSPTIHQSTTLTNNSSEDKQELERQRLMAEVSTPIYQTEASSDNVHEISSGITIEQPTAPILSEEDGSQNYFLFMNPLPSINIKSFEVLPRYEK